MYFLGEKKVRSITGAPGKLLSVLYYDQRSHTFSDERLLCQKKNNKNPFKELDKFSTAIFRMIYVIFYIVFHNFFSR